MNTPRDGWDADEQDALDGLEAELAELRRKHQDEPSLAMLRAADANALPPEMQARVARHLQDSRWSQALVDGLREAGADDRLDAESEERLFKRITREAQAVPAPQRRWTFAVATGGLALAATLLIAVVLQRSVPAPVIAPDDAPSTPVVTPPSAATPTPAPLRLAYAKPEVKLSPSALAWRGDAAANPFVRALAPAIEAYRAGDYPRAVAEFDRLSTVYPESIEVLFYQGVSRMLAGDDAGAIAPLDAAARLRNTTFADDVAWYLAVARQRSGRSGARAAFEELCRGNGAYRTAACSAVQQLDSPPADPKRQ